MFRYKSSTCTELPATAIVNTGFFWETYRNNFRIFYRKYRNTGNSGNSAWLADVCRYHTMGSSITCNGTWMILGETKKICFYQTFFFSECTPFERWGKRKKNFFSLYFSLEIRVLGPAFIYNTLFIYIVDTRCTCPPKWTEQI